MGTLQDCTAKAKFVLLLLRPVLTLAKLTSIQCLDSSRVTKTSRSISAEIARMIFWIWSQISSTACQLSRYRQLERVNLQRFCGSTPVCQDRRKFRSQTSDNMDIWKSRDGKSQGRKRVRRKKMQVREKVDKSRNTVVLQCFVAPDSGGLEGRLAKAASAEPSGCRWEMKTCMPLWREAHFEVNTYETSGSEHFWQLRCWKSARFCGVTRISKSKQ